MVTKQKITGSACAKRKGKLLFVASLLGKVLCFQTLLQGFISITFFEIPSGFIEFFDFAKYHLAFAITQGFRFCFSSFYRHNTAENDSNRVKVNTMMRKW